MTAALVAARAAGGAAAGGGAAAAGRAGASAASGGGRAAAGRAGGAGGGSRSTSTAGQSRRPASASSRASAFAQPPNIRKSARKVLPRKGKAMRGRQLLVAEFLVCMVILAFAPAAGSDKTKDAVAWMKRATAVCALFLILGLVSAGGPAATKAASGLGGLVTLALLLNERNMFGFMVTKLTGKKTTDFQGDYELRPPTAGEAYGELTPEPDDTLGRAGTGG